MPDIFNLQAAFSLQFWYKNNQLIIIKYLLKYSQKIAFNLI